MRSMGGRLSFVAALATIAALAAAGCGSSDGDGDTATGSSAAATSGASTAEQKPINIALFGYNSTPYSAAGVNAAKAEAEKLGAKVTTFNPESDPKAQATEMQDAIQTGKYQGFWVLSLDGVRLQPLVQQAAEKGIKVVAADATLGSAEDQKVLKEAPGVVATIGAGINDSADIFVDEAKAACTAKVGEGKPCTVALMAGMRTFPGDGIRIPYIKKELEATGYIKTVAMPDGQYATPGALKSTLDFFQTKPDVDVILSLADQMTIGIVQALKQLGLKAGEDVYVIGYGATKTAVAGIKDGSWFASVGLYPAVQGTLGVQYLVDAINGKDVPALTNVYEVDGALKVIDATVLEQNPDFSGDWDG